MVDALGGEPGVRSHRWLGGGTAAHGDLDRALAEEVIRRMAGVEAARRGARLRAATALVYHEHGRIHERVSEAALEGHRRSRVAADAQGVSVSRGALLADRGCYVGELSDEDAARLSQRRTALEGLRADLMRIAGSR